ncbi:uncharacterized protein BDV14DRAFT_13841 [Aspergillus stella-maris]|uniref:uncharacterized protein n=1 Tax=Aspergillus stella-maris TaxID=1810926 RepID=UPI003CCD2D6D
MTSKPVILVTGGNQGLGYETLKALAQAKKYRLVVAARSQEKAENAIRSLASETSSAMDDFTPVVIDLIDDATIQSAADLIRSKFGHLDILINNAGINRSPDGNASLREDLRAVFETNVFGVAVMNQTFLPLLRASSYPQRRIVTVTSGMGMFGVAVSKSSTYSLWNYKVPVYRASKAAVNMLAAAENVENEADGIPTVLVCPGYCRTAFGGYMGHKDADAGGRCIARAATEGANEVLGLKAGVLDDEGKFGDFGW